MPTHHPRVRKRRPASIGHRHANKTKKDPPTPSALLKEPPESSISSPPATRKRALAFVSPQQPKRKQPKRTTTSGGLPVQELLEIFTQLEELEGSDLKAATVHGRKNLQAMVEQGRATTDVSTVVETTDDSTAVAGGGSTINSATGGPPTELQIPTAMAPRMTLKPSQHPKPDDLIPIPNDCFNINNQGKPRTPSAVTAHKCFIKKRLKVAFLEPDLSPPQQAWLLRALVTDKAILRPSASAGLLAPPTNDCIINNIKETVKLATWTKHAFGRPTDDKRSLVQSIVLASLPSPTSPTTTKPTTDAIASALGLPIATHRRHVKAATPKRAALEDPGDNSTVCSQVLKSKGHTKIKPEVQDKMCSFIKEYPHAVHSPIKNDTILVGDPNDPSAKIRKTKLLLQVSICELHNDLIAKVPSCTKNGKPLLSDWKLRMILPKEVRRMTAYHKTMCACIVCVQMRLHQTSHNRFKCRLLKQMKDEINSVRAGVRSRVPLMEAMEECKNQSNFKETIKEAVERVICKPGPSITSNWMLKDLCHIKCAHHGRCSRCPSFAMPTAENNSTESISFQSYECVHSCSEHGKLNEGARDCPLCSNLREGEKKGKIQKKRNLVHLERPFTVFMKDHHLKSLYKFKRHRFLCIILSQNVIGKDREDIIVNETSTHRDHSERLKVECNNQVQEEHCGSNPNVSMEGCAAKFINPGTNQPRKEFFTHFSDSKLQDASTTHWNMSHLVACLKKQEVLTKNGLILCNSDGCSGETIAF